ncbi:MAG: cobalamin-binding protein [Planctomycetaceae bacterium]
MPHRIVTLIASATEIVAALGFEDALVGRSHECDYPASVLKLPTCSEAKVDPGASSREIDRQVKAVLREALSVYRVDAELLRELEPTLIVTQTQCEVCAVSLKDVEQAVCEFWRAGGVSPPVRRAVDEFGSLVAGITGGLTPPARPTIVSLEPMRLADLWTDIRLVAQALDAPERSETLIAELKDRLDRLAAKTAAIAIQPTIACIEWIDPLMAAGNWVPELVEIAGGRNLFGEAGKHSPWMTWEQLVERDPEVIAIMPCGFDIDRTRGEMAPLIDRLDWQNLRAVRTGRVFLTDGNQYFTRPGPRLVESAEILAELLHPEAFDFGHRDTGWTPFAAPARLVPSGR